MVTVHRRSMHSCAAVTSIVLRCHCRGRRRRMPLRQWRRSYRHAVDTRIRERFRPARAGRAGGQRRGAAPGVPPILMDRSNSRPPLRRDARGAFTTLPTRARLRPGHRGCAPGRSSRCTAAARASYASAAGITIDDSSRSMSGPTAALANETNRLANDFRVPVDDAFRGYPERQASTEPSTSNTGSAKGVSRWRQPARSSWHGCPWDRWSVPWVRGRPAHLNRMWARRPRAQEAPPA